MEDDKLLFYMQIALKEAKKALEKEEVPIGAVIVDPEGNIIGRGHNLKETTKDPTAHAEIIAIREASQKIGDWRLEGCTLFSTIEPCIMCCGAIIQARISKVYYGAPDPKFGAVESLYRIFDDERLNHRVQYQGGILQEECAQLLKDFFKALRNQ
ncbi:cytosine deaminase [Thermosulfidibacter takaii ABI70S6]|uniref:tRNA-specific adenosine deaminase n=2 Tax=Thermosulfidibacter takaii TaxID=412593 RepID=A0A0S3QUF8_THET7|nr:cytosine deaminase [Thermosulfidibacter takaii ABI70S6]